MNENKTPILYDAGSGIQAYVRVLNFISWGVSLLKKSKKIIGSFRFKVMISPIYSIQREVTNLNLLLLLLHCVFQKLFFVLTKVSLN